MPRSTGATRTAAWGTGALAACFVAVSAPAAAAGARSADTAPEALVQPAPPPGQYDAQMCVAVAGAAAQCGPVTADVGEGGHVRVRISDIVYRLEPWGELLGITLMHGTMQIDGFFARYQWAGRTLQFVDSDKGTRYELKVGARRFD